MFLIRESSPEKQNPGRHSGAVFTARGLRVGLHVSPVSVWVHPGSSVFLPPSHQANTRVLRLRCSLLLYIVFVLVSPLCLFAGFLLGHTGCGSGSRGLWSTQRVHHYHWEHCWKGVTPNRLVFNCRHTTS